MGLCWGYLGIMEKMETTRLYRFIILVILRKQAHRLDLWVGLWDISVSYWLYKDPTY